ncbi:MAG: substrate-binding domain-containing protein, partial [Spirochaetes bacterium]|nr:substrate-binding domain-containing protein [Spirochaetota bacterium]
MSRNTNNKDIKNKSKHRPTIAAFLDLINYSYHERYWQGLVQGALNQDINLISYPDIYYSGRPRDYYNQINAMIDLANNPKIDGIINWSSTFAWTIKKEKFKDFFQKIKDDPNSLRLISYPENTPIIIMESYEGLRQIMIHLIKVHGVNKIAYLRGPENHMGSNERYRAYLDTLKEFNIKYDPDLVTPPTLPGKSWIPEIGEEMTNLLLDRKKQNIEAIIAVSDTIAYGVLNCLNKRGIKIPNDIIVTGFDDYPLSSTSIPTLTTIDPCFEQIGEKTVEMLTKILNGEKTPLHQYVKSKLVLRQSCGCNSPLISKMEIKNDKLKFYNINFKNKINKLYENNKNIIKKEAEKIIADFSSEKKADMLIEFFFEDILDKDSVKLIPLLIEIMQTVVINNENTIIWYQFFSFLYSIIFPYLKDDQIIIRLLNLIQQISIIINDTVLQIQKRKTNFEKKQEETLSEIEKELITIFDKNILMNEISKKLPLLGIKLCFLSLYEEKIIPSVWSNLILAYIEEKKIDLQNDAIRFPTIDLIPTQFLKEEKKFNIVIMPLYFQQEQLGFVIFEIGPKNGNIYERLRSILSSSIKGSILVKEIEQRSKELDKAYQELKDNQQKMLIIEKMASLGRLTAGIAHEMNTPLAAVSSSLEELKSLTEEYKSSINNPQVLPEDHREIAEEMTKFIDIASNAIRKTTGFIRGIKGQTLNIKSKNLETFNAS